MSLQNIIDKALQDKALNRNEAQLILDWDDEDILSLVQGVYPVRKHFFGKRIKMHTLMNIQSGMCAEDCSYCSQSRSSHAEVESYRMLQPHFVLPAAKKAVDNGSSKLCLVASMRGPTQRDLDVLTESIRQVRSHYPDLEICVSLGILQDGQAAQLRSAGVSTYNHNLNTSEEHYAEICTSHTFQDRLDTVRQAQSAGLLTCSGAILGMGESDKDIIDLAFQLRELKARSIPLNFLIPIPGTVLESLQELSPQRCLKILALFRLINPSAEIRAAAGRELHLRSFQPLALYLANSLFLGDYLTTKGQSIQADLDMIRDHGFVIEGVDPDIGPRDIREDVEMIKITESGCGCSEGCSC